MQPFEPGVWQEGDRFHLFIPPRSARFLDSNGEYRYESDFSGRIGFRITERVSDEEARVAVDELVFAGAAAFVGEEALGRYCFDDVGGEGVLAADGSGLVLKLDLATNLQYIRLLLDRDVNLTGQDFYPGELEDFRGQLDCYLTHDGERYSVIDGQVALEYVEGGFGWISRVEAPLAGSSMVARPPLPQANQTLFALRAAQFPARQTTTLYLTPIRFVDENGIDTATNADTLLAWAQQIWGQCCIQVVATESVSIDRPDLTIDNPADVDAFLTAVRNSYEYWKAQNRPNPYAIPVYFVNSSLTEVGGGHTLGWTTSSVVVTNNFANNPHVLAHELGHVLHGFHFDESSSLNGAWTGELGTIMEATGLADPNPVHLSNTVRQFANHPLLRPQDQIQCQQSELEL